MEFLNPYETVDRCLQRVRMVREKVLGEAELIIPDDFNHTTTMESVRPRRSTAKYVPFASKRAVHKRIRKPREKKPNYINRLPTEVLMEIFLYFAFSGAWISRFSAPINLNSVCHEWRVVASSMPCLWQQIHIKLHCRRRGPNFKPLLTIFFNNSRSRNLEIKLPNPAKPPSLFERNIVYCQHQDLLKFIAPEMYRCQALSGYVSIQDICLLLSSSDREAETCLPSLKELDLAGCLRYNQDVGSFPFPIIFTTLSQILTKVILSDVSCFNMDERRLLQFLQCCPNLEYLSIGGVTVQYGTLLRLPIRYMKLHHLELRFPTNVPLPSSDFATRMLDRMPNLKHFSLSLTHRFCPGTQCSTDAALVSSYLTTCPERILGLLLPACLLANLRESIARQPGSQDLNLRLLAIHETGSLYFDYIMKKVKETLEHSATELILDRQWESNVEKIRTECLDCCYEEHHYSSDKGVHILFY